MARGQRDGFIFREEKICWRCIEGFCSKMSRGVKRKNEHFLFYEKVGLYDKVKKKKIAKRKRKKKEKSDKVPIIKTLNNFF